MSRKKWICLAITFSLLAAILCACSEPKVHTEIPGGEPGSNPVDFYPAPGNEVPSPDEAISSSPYPSPDEPLPSDWQPRPGDQSLQPGEVFIEQKEILVLESFPPQYILLLKGNLPTVCHQLRVKINPADAQKHILVEVYSLVNPGEACIQVLAPFEVSIPLGSLEAGKYVVVVNGEKAGEISP
ncbi:MAG: hypothetical protein JXB15_07765 [Anaerolineales bacterium]|nr:hypothetical protein [Anaerolineales bacterium]